jgi:hypothetical protein
MGVPARPLLKIPTLLRLWRRLHAANAPHGLGKTPVRRRGRLVLKVRGLKRGKRRAPGKGLEELRVAKANTVEDEDGSGAASEGFGESS